MLEHRCEPYSLLTAARLIWRTAYATIDWRPAQRCRIIIFRHCSSLSQTGAGKTHTMEGRPDPPFLRGIIPNSFQHIFDHISNASNFQFLVRASYLEIYNEEIRDLLSKDPKNSLELKENLDTGVYVKDLTSFVVKNVTEIDHVMQAGKKNRSTG